MIKKANKSAEDDLILEDRVLKVIFDETSDWRQKSFTYPNGFSLKRMAWFSRLFMVYQKSNTLNEMLKTKGARKLLMLYLLCIPQI